MIHWPRALWEIFVLYIYTHLHIWTQQALLSYFQAYSKIM